MGDITRAGDSVRYVAQERVDLPDFMDQSDTVRMALAVLQSGIMGQCAGIVGKPPPFVWNAGPKTLTVGTAGPPAVGCTLGYGTETGSYGASQFACVAYEPGSAWQPSALSIPLGAFHDTDTPCVLWARRSQAQADSATRIVWSGGAETATPVNTVVRETLAMGASAVGSPPAWPWFPFAKITAWVAGVPTVAPLSIWDGVFQGAQLGDAAIMTAYPNIATGLHTPGGNVAYGLGKLALLMRNTLARLIKADGTVPWYDTSDVTMGVEDLAPYASVLKGSAMLPIAGAVVKFTAGPTYTLDVTYHCTGIANPGTGITVVTFTVPTGWIPLYGVTTPTTYPAPVCFVGAAYPVFVASHVGYDEWTIEVHGKIGRAHV